LIDITIMATKSSKRSGRRIIMPWSGMNRLFVMKDYDTTPMRVRLTREKFPPLLGYGKVDSRQDVCQGHGHSLLSVAVAQQEKFSHALEQLVQQ
jgi:hypothetical protein